MSMDIFGMLLGAAKGFALMSLGFVLGMLFMRENYLGIIERLLERNSGESPNRGRKW